MAAARAATARASASTSTCARATASVVSSSVISAASVGFFFSAFVMGIYKTVGMYVVSVSDEESAPSVIGDHTVEQIRLDYENKCRG